MAMVTSKEFAIAFGPRGELISPARGSFYDALVYWTGDHYRALADDGHTIAESLNDAAVAINAAHAYLPARGGVVALMDNLELRTNVTITDKPVLFKGLGSGRKWPGAGASYAPTYLTWAGAANGVMFDIAPTVENAGSGLENMQLYGLGCDKGVYAHGFVNNLHFRNVIMRKFTTNGSHFLTVDVHALFDVYHDNCMWGDCGDNVKCEQGGGATFPPEYFTFVHCFTNSNAQNKWAAILTGADAHWFGGSIGNGSGGGNGLNLIKAYDAVIDVRFEGYAPIPAGSPIGLQYTGNGLTVHSLLNYWDKAIRLGVATADEAKNYKIWAEFNNNVTDVEATITGDRDGIVNISYPVYTAAKIINQRGITDGAYQQLKIGLHPPPDPVAVGVGGSPWAWQNTLGYTVDCIVSGGTVSLLEFSKYWAIAWINVGFTNGIIPSVQPGQRIRITHTGAPTFTYKPTPW